MNSKLVIGYFADGPWGHNALDLLLSDKTIEIAFIIPRNDTKDGYLKDKAEKNSIDFLCPIDVNSTQFYEQAERYNCDLFVSMSYNQIFRKKIYNLPRLRTINCHAGKLPFYRGRNILNWVLINDEKEFGITVHYVDDGIDTGDIILQRTFPITDDDDYSTLLSVAYGECPKILYEAIKQIQKGEVKPIAQDTISPYGLYCGMRKFGDEIVDFSNTSRELFNFVRAICSPGPMAVAYVDEKTEVRINRVEYNVEFPKYKGVPGQIIALLGGKPVMKTQDSYVILTDYICKRKLRVGDRLKGK